MNSIEHTFADTGNHTVALTANHLTIHKAKKEISGAVTQDGWYYIEGITYGFKLNIIILDSEPVYFTRGDNYTGEYGFDNYEKTELREQYETLEIEKADGNKIEYAIPYMSISTDNPYTVMADIKFDKKYRDAVRTVDRANKGTKTAAYTFTATGGISINGSQSNSVYPENLTIDEANGISLQIRRTAAGAYNNPATVTVQDVTGKIVGKMNVITANVDKTEPINLVKVYLGDSLPVNNSKTPQQLLNEAVDFMNNKAYNQLFASFDAGNKAEFVITDAEIDTINKRYGGKSQILNEKGEIKVQPHGGYPEYGVIDEFLRQGNKLAGWTGKTIIVIANRNKEKDGNSQTSGFALTDKKTHTGNDIILYYRGSVDYTTYTHELGHLFGLQHPFSDDDPQENIDKPQSLIGRGSSQNYMDYSPITNMFWKWQWKILRDNIGKIGEGNEQNQQNQ